MNKFITPTTIIALLTMLCQTVCAADQQKNLQQISQAGHQYMTPLLPFIIPICCPACRKPCGFMGLTSCKCYKDRVAAIAAEKEAAQKEAARKEAALKEAAEKK